MQRTAVGGVEIEFVEMDQLAISEQPRTLKVDPKRLAWAAGIRNITEGEMLRILVEANGKMEDQISDAMYVAAKKLKE